MNYQPQLQPRFDFEPVPEPRQKVRRLMQAFGLVVDGLIDQQPGTYNPHLSGCFYMSQASLLITGTACRRPLVLREAREIALASGLDAIVVRMDEEGDATFDIQLQHLEPLLCRYCLWMERPGETAWLVPSAGEPHFLSISPFGLELTAAAPFSSPEERSAGLDRGSEFLSVAVKGWF